MVEEAGERVGAGLVLEALSDLGVIERKRRSVAETLGDLELRLGERDAVAFAIDIQRALDLAARDERDADEGFGLHRRSGHGANARVEVRLVAEHSLTMAGRPAGDAFREADRRVHDLVRVHVAHEHRLEHVLCLVGLVDRQRVERRDQVADGVGDAHQEGVEALLGEDLVEDVGEPPVRLDEGRSPAGGSSSSSRRGWAGLPPIPQSIAVRYTFEAPRSGPQRTDEASVRGPARESLVRVNTHPDASPCRGRDRSRRPTPRMGAAGKRRIHAKPSWSGLTACRPWLEVD